MPAISSIVLLVTNEGMGHSDRALQLKLIDKYLRLLEQSNLLPNAICFYTDGVKLVVEGSPVLDILQAFTDKGVRLIVCSTCLEYLGLTDKVRVGIVGGMPDIIEAQYKADKVITI
ncbi:MAG TPA: DsrE family protein [Anaerolineaceae bacterium]|nr:DsrE family protein [Anaerolineaceae bacterium]